MSGDYDDGYDIGVRAVGRILRNLIAELRGDTGICDDVGVKEYTDRAEARLREVQGE